jgi:diguanylate cyclase (GGDEF)-like protein
VVRREAASDRSRSSQDRQAGATERTKAELDRETALADREAGASERSQAEVDRGAGASERDQAESDRDTALTDRSAGAKERISAGLDRSSSLADRAASARERETSSHDGLTGVYLRAAGFFELEREIARAHREMQPLTLAFIDIDNLKAINDTRGHTAGDQTLIEIANILKKNLRSYDLIVRYGGDEFVCSLTGMTIADAAERVAQITAALAEAPERVTVTIGLAELQPDDSLEDLIARADAALYKERQR